MLDGQNGVPETTSHPKRLPAIKGIEVLCPMCSCLCSDHASFENHFDTVHAIAASEWLHFQSWKRYRHGRWMREHQRIPRPWRSLCHAKIETQIEIRCPACEYYIPSGNPQTWGPHRYVKTDHHLDMLANPDDIKPFRREILRLYPGFVTHPVWDDMNETNIVSEEISSAKYLNSRSNGHSPLGTKHIMSMTDPQATPPFSWLLGSGGSLVAALKMQSLIKPIGNPEKQHLSHCLLT